MKSIFHLSLLCLFIMSCQEDQILMSDNPQIVQERTANSLKATLLLQDGSTFQTNACKAKCKAYSESLISVKLFYSNSDSSSVICKSLQLENSNEQLKLMTTSPNNAYFDKKTCFVTPSGSSQIKISIQPGDITLFPNSFIGEDQDGF